MIRVDKQHGALACLAVLAMVFSGSTAAESLSCVAERASGFVYDEQSESWQTIGFSVENRQYLVSPANQDDIIARALKYDYQITEAGSSKPVIHCRAVKLADSNQETGLIMCKGAFGASFNIDREAGRYIRSQPNGYVTRQASTQSADGPYMEIGSCKSN